MKQTFDHNLELVRNLTTQEIEMCKNVLKVKHVQFFFRPSLHLRNLVARNIHPVISQLPEGFKTGILLDATIDLSHQMIIAYLENTLNEPYKTMITMGELRARHQKVTPKTSSDVILTPNQIS